MRDDPFPMQPWSPGGVSGLRVGAVLAVALSTILGLGGVFTVYGAALEPDAYASRVCARAVGDGPAWDECLRRVRAEPRWRPGAALWTLAGIALGSALAMEIVDARRRHRDRRPA